MIAYRIHLIRTGSTACGQEKRYVGRTDLPLSEQGIARLDSLLDAFDYPRVEMVFSSPLSRCTETAEILYPDYRLETMDALLDMDLGSFAGKSFDELKNNPDFSAWINDSKNNPPPGGESSDAFIRRIVAGINKIFFRMMDEKMRNVAVITHGGVIMSLLSAIGMPRHPLHVWACENGAGYTLLFTPQMWMRDSCAEVYGKLPIPFCNNENELYDTYFE